MRISGNACEEVREGMSMPRSKAIAISLAVLLLLLVSCAGQGSSTSIKPSPPSSQPGARPEPQSKPTPAREASTQSSGPKPVATPSRERLTLGEALARARSHVAQLGYPNAALWQVDIGREFGRDGRGVWELRLYDPTSKRQILYSFDQPSDQRVAIFREPMTEVKDFPVGDIAPSEQLASRNPDVWAFVDSLPAPKFGPKAWVSVGIEPFRGPSPWYQHDRKAWVISVNYPTGEEQGRVLLEDRRFWAAIDTGNPIYDEGGGVYDESGKPIR